MRTIIGPNGAGKTTFFNLLSGLLPPSDGRVWFDGRDMTALPPYQRARLGIARSFQITNIFGRLSVRENVRLAAQAVRRRTARTSSSGGKPFADVDERTQGVLETIGLAGQRTRARKTCRTATSAGSRSGSSLARDPKVLLLDEPLAGMSPAETQATVELITRIARPPDGGAGRTVLLVEHDIDVVMAISDTITVMQTGAVLATGTPAEIRANERVRRAYLGDLA